jgi:ATP-dependent Lon protease
MELDLTLPDEVPVMTLPNVAFFPQALMPLHIFEPRYRHMLKDVLATDRLFAVAGVDAKLAGARDQFEPPHRVASVGMIRACQKNGDGTSNLLLQGLCRVELLRIVADRPYRRIKIRVLTSETGGAAPENVRLREELARLLLLKQKLGAPLSRDMTEFLSGIDDPETFVDLAAFNFCDCHLVKQKLLETLDIQARLRLFADQLRDDVAALRLQRKLQGPLGDDRIENN